MKGYIYKISSIDDKLYYYGLTTNNVYCRLYWHIKGYINYTKTKSKNYCSSYKIFEKYGIDDDIKIKIIEKYDDIKMSELKKREIYYIQNNDCCNIMQKEIHKYKYNGKELKKYKDFTDEEKKHNLEKIKNKDISVDIQYVCNLINVLGYELNDKLNQINDRIFYKDVKLVLKEFITDYYKLFNLDINVNNNNILSYISKILSNYNLILNKKNIKTKKNDKTFINNYSFELLIK